MTSQEHDINLSICRFLEAKIFTMENYLDHEEEFVQFPKDFIYSEGRNTFLMEDLQFHMSFDKLMKVVEYVERKDFGFKMCRKVVEIYIDSTKQTILHIKEDSRFNSLLKAITSFIGLATFS